MQRTAASRWSGQWARTAIVAYSSFPDVGHLWKFCCNNWVLNESKNRSKLDLKLKKMVFVGFMDGSKAIWYYDTKSQSIEVSQNVTFNENDKPRESEIVEVPGVQIEGEIRENSSQKLITPQKPAAELHKPEPRQLWQTAFIDYSKVNNLNARLPTWRTPKPDDQTNLAEELFLGTTFLTTGAEEDLPRYYDKTINCPEANHWKKAMDAKMGIIKEMGTWKEAELPEGRNKMQTGIHKEEGWMQKNCQIQGTTSCARFFSKTQSRLLRQWNFLTHDRFETLRAMLAHTAIHNWKLWQFDIKGTYLHGHLEEEIYMAQPPGYEDGSQQVWKLIRALYRLKQAGFQEMFGTWNWMKPSPN